MVPAFNEISLETREVEGGHVVPWAVLCSVGTLASAFRLLLPSYWTNHVWFRVQRRMPATMVFLNLRAGGADCVFVIALQLITAVTAGEKKSGKRVAWEITHKLVTIKKKRLEVENDSELR